MSLKPLHILSFCSLLVILVVIPDVILSALHSILSFVVYIGHTLFEMLELSLDIIVEHILETSPHQTQTIVFYILLALLIYGLHRLWLLGVRLYHSFVIKWQQTKVQASNYWQSQSTLKKTQVIILASSLFMSLFFLF